MTGRAHNYCESHWQCDEMHLAGMQALEQECDQLRQAATESVTELAEERRRGISKERKLMDRTHEAAKLREQLQSAESKHQVQHLNSMFHHHEGCRVNLARMVPSGCVFMPCCRPIIALKGGKRGGGGVRELPMRSGDKFW